MCRGARIAPLQPGQTLDEARAILGDAMRRPLFTLRATGGDLVAYGVDADGSVEHRGRHVGDVLLFGAGRYVAKLESYVASRTAPCLIVPGGRDAIAAHLRALAADPATSARVPVPLPPAGSPLANCTLPDTRNADISAGEVVIGVLLAAHIVPAGAAGMIILGPFVPSMKATDERRRASLEEAALGMSREDLERTLGPPDSGVSAAPVEGEVWHYQFEWDPDVCIGLERNRVVWIASEAWVDCFGA